MKIELEIKNPIVKIAKTVAMNGLTNTKTKEITNKITVITIPIVAISKNLSLMFGMLLT